MPTPRPAAPTPPPLCRHGQTQAQADHAYLRWQRLQMSIRCALFPGQPALVRCWLGLGQALVRNGRLDDAAAQLRMLKLLLAVSHDATLPWFWRSVCLEHANQPLARLRVLLALHDPLAAHALEAGVQAARDALPALPSAGPAAHH